MQGEIKKNENITANSKQIERLKSLFPNCFDKCGKFLPHKLEEIIKAEGIDVTREGYKLDWLGKSYARLLANLETETLLIENIDHNIKSENINSQNILIQGDNLDVLKHLVNSYHEKIKMIYIDPPYNRGSDGFIYADDRKFTPEQLSSMAGIDELEAKRILDFTQSKSHSHSAWLTFMYPRLYIARELLREDGVIFLSIDDNEQAQLKLLCDEVFGEENFVELFIKKSKIGGGSDSKHIAVEHEYILSYSKNIQSLPEMFEKHDKEYLKRYKDEDENGRFFWDTFARPGLKNPMNYDIQAEDGTIINGDWIWSEERFKTGYKDGEVKVIKKENGKYTVHFKQYLNLNGKKPRSMTSEFGGTSDGKAELEELFKIDKIFPYPKSTKHISKLCEIIQYEENDIILDFFAGSGTTAHAIMALNAVNENKKQRQYICVQLDEPTPEKSEARKAGYETVFHITRERIMRAAEKIQNETPLIKCDLGFKEYKTIPANQGQFEHYLDNAETMEDYVPFNGFLLDNDAIMALLTTWKVYDGLPLTQELIKIDLEGYTAYQGGHILYFVHKGLTVDHIVEMLRRLDEDDSFILNKLVVFHHVHGDKILREFNEAVSAPNRKHLELVLDVRF